MAFLAPLLGGVGSVMGGIGGKNAQKQANQQAQQAAQAQQQMMQSILGSVSPILQNYQNGTMPAENSLISSLMGGASSPGGGSITNPYMQAAGGTMGQLQNFQGLKPQEMSALQTSLGQGGQSTINTLMSRLGGAANPNALAQSLLGQNSQNSLNLGTQLGAQGAGQELGALQSAGSIGQGLSGQQMGGWGQALSSLGQLFGLQTGPAMQGLGALGGISGQYGQAGAQAAQNSAAQGNPWAQAFGGLSQAFAAQPASGGQAYGGGTASPFTSGNPMPSSGFIPYSSSGGTNMVTKAPAGGV